MSYILQAMYETPWAILPAKLEAIEMQAVSATGQLMSHKGESAGLGQAYQG